MLHQIGRILITILSAITSAQVGVALSLVYFGKKLRAHKGYADYPTRRFPPISTENADIQLYMNGWTLYDDMIADIENAQETIYFETFEWRDDEMGNRFYNALVARAEAGVKVFIIYDRIATLLFNGALFDFSHVPNVEVLLLNAMRHASRLLQRRHWAITHRKIMVIDCEIGYVGGYNIGDNYGKQWRDTHMRLKGTGVAGLTYAFVDLWNTNRRSDLPELPYADQPWNADIQILRNVPYRHDYPIRSVYLSGLERADTRVIFTNPYLVPDSMLREALVLTAQRGVEVIILFPWRSDQIVTDWIARRFIDQLLAGGVKLFAYEGTMIHAKTVTVDGEWSCIGSANLDRLSLRVNHEITAAVFSQEVAEQLEEMFEIDSSTARELTLEKWRNRPIKMRIGELILSPLWRFV